MRSFYVQPSLVVLLELLKSTPTTGQNNIFQDGAGAGAGAGAAEAVGAAGAGAGPGWGNIETDDGGYIDIPYGCHELIGDKKKLQQCIDQWYDEYYANEVVPDECIDLSGLDLHNCIETYLASLSASPTSSPSYSPTSGGEPPTLPPSVEEIYHTASLPNDVTTMVELPSESNNPDMITNDSNTDNVSQSDFVSTTDDANTDQDSTIVYGKPEFFCFVVFR